MLITIVCRLADMPSFLISPFSQVVGRGRSVNLECVVTGNPPPTVFWSKGQEQVAYLSFLSTKYVVVVVVVELPQASVDDPQKR